MIRIDLIRELKIPEPASLSLTRVLVNTLAAATLAAVHVALNWQATDLAATRNSLRLEIAQDESQALRQQLSPTPAAGDGGGLAATAQVALRLRRVAAAVPDDLWLIGYNERRGEVAMRGMTSNHDAPRTFVENLAATAAFGPLEIVETARRTSTDGKRIGEAGVEEFSLRAVIGGHPGVAQTPGSGS